jgi:hypothetical protein
MLCDVASGAGNSIHHIQIADNYLYLSWRIRDTPTALDTTRPTLNVHALTVLARQPGYETVPLYDPPSSTLAFWEVKAPAGVRSCDSFI